jgi:exoribonuclease R
LPLRYGLYFIPDNMDQNSCDLVESQKLNLKICDATTASMSDCFGFPRSISLESDMKAASNALKLDKIDRSLKENPHYHISESFNTYDRQDLGSMVGFAIDDPETTEVDDAISLHFDDQGKEWVYVHIADPSSHLDPRGPLVQEYCARTATSIYLPHKRFSMLPSQISHSVSLSDFTEYDQNEKKQNRQFHYVLTHKFRIDGGNIVDGSIFTGVLRNVHRLSYENVDKYLIDPIDNEDHIQKTLKRLFEISKEHLAHRKSMGAIQFVWPKPIIKLSKASTGADHSPYIVDRIVNEYDLVRSPSRILVSECMILCNRMTALWCNERSIPIPYRVQDIPNAMLMSKYSIVQDGGKNLQKLQENVMELFSTINDMYPISYERYGSKERLSDELASKIPQPSYLSKVKECLGWIKRSINTCTPTSHWMLGLPLYTRATSPMRRYTDFLVQVQIKAYLSKKNYLEEEFFSSALLEHLDNISYRVHWLQKQSNFHWLLRYIYERQQLFIKSGSSPKPYQGVVIQTNYKSMQDLSSANPQYNTNTIFVYIHELSCDFSVNTGNSSRSKSYNIGDGINLVPKEILLAYPSIQWDIVS